MITTMYGSIQDYLLGDFCKVSGWRYENNEWTVLKDECEFWQLVNPTSTVEERKWQKKTGLLPIRDFNFQYALYKNPITVKGANGGDIKSFDIPKAIKYAKETLFDFVGKPIYLPDEIEKEACKQNGKFYDSNKKPKSYNKILEEEKLNFEQYD